MCGYNVHTVRKTQWCENVSCILSFSQPGNQTPARTLWAHPPSESIAHRSYDNASQVYHRNDQRHWEQESLVEAPFLPIGSGFCKPSRDSIPDVPASRGRKPYQPLDGSCFQALSLKLILAVLNKPFITPFKNNNYS